MNIQYTSLRMSYYANTYITQCNWFNSLRKGVDNGFLLTRIKCHLYLYHPGVNTFNFQADPIKGNKTLFTFYKVPSKQFTNFK